MVCDAEDEGDIGGLRGAMSGATRSRWSHLRSRANCEFCFALSNGTGVESTIALHLRRGFVLEESQGVSNHVAMSNLLSAILR